MCRRLIRLFRILLPAFVMIAAWGLWFNLPETPLVERRLNLEGGLRDSPSFDPFGDFADFSTWQYGAIRSFASGQRDETRSVLYDNSRVVDWRLNLHTAQFERRPRGESYGPWILPTRAWKVDQTSDGFSIVDTQKGATLLSLPPPNDAKLVERGGIIGFRSDGRMVATDYGLPDGVDLWRIPDQQRVGHFDGVSFPWTFAPDNQLFVGYSKSTKSYQVIDSESGKLLTQIPHQGKPHWFRVSSSGFLLTHRNSESLGIQYDVWRLPSGENHGVIKVQFRKHNGAPLAYQFSPDGRLVDITSAADGRIWDLSRKPPRRLDGVFTSPGEDYEIAPAGQTFLVFERIANAWKLYETATGKIIAKHQYPTDAKCSCPAVSPDGRWVSMAFQRPLDTSSIRFRVLQLFGLKPPTDPEQQLEIIDATSGTVVNCVPAWQVDRWNRDGNQFWTSETVYNTAGKPAGVAFREWSALAASPRWWLWLGTAGGVALTLRDIRRWTRPAKT